MAAECVFDAIVANWIAAWLCIDSVLTCLHNCAKCCGILHSSDSARCQGLHKHRRIWLKLYPHAKLLMKSSTCLFAAFHIAYFHIAMGSLINCLFSTVAVDTQVVMCQLGTATVCAWHVAVDTLGQYNVFWQRNTSTKQI